MTGGAELQQNETLAGDLTDELVAKAMRNVAARATDAAEARDLLEMLGLVEPVHPAAPQRDICGTLNGRYRHVQLDERVCRLCADAWNAYRRTQSGGDS